MSTPEFDKFDLEGLSLEDMSPAPAKAEKPDVPEKPEIPNSTDSLENILDAESAQVEEIEPAPAPEFAEEVGLEVCLLYTSPSPRDATLSRMPSSA